MDNCDWLTRNGYFMSGKEKKNIENKYTVDVVPISNANRFYVHVFFHFSFYPTLISCKIQAGMLNGSEHFTYIYCSQVRPEISLHFTFSQNVINFAIH